MKEPEMRSLGEILSGITHQINVSQKIYRREDIEYWRGEMAHWVDAEITAKSQKERDDAKQKQQEVAAELERLGPINSAETTINGSKSDQDA